MVGRGFFFFEEEESLKIIVKPHQVCAVTCHSDPEPAQGSLAFSGSKALGQSVFVRSEHKVLVSMLLLTLLLPLSPHVCGGKATERCVTPQSQH